ncbi:MAG TPA: type IV pilin protein [Vicinamibacterales bacterium]
MRAVGLIGLVIALGIGYFVFTRTATGPTGAPPQQQIDTAAIRQRLLAIGETERQYVATHGSYATLEQLAAEELLPGGTEQRGYTFTGTANGSSGFTITATPTDPEKSGWPTLEISETMQVTEK